MAIRRRGRRKPPARKREDPHRINDKIRVAEVRLVGPNVEMGIYPVDQALAIAKKQGLDLVEISPKAEPPVAKVLDYKKFLYNQRKREKELKVKQAKVVVKEIRFGPQTDAHDYAFKRNHAQRFLSDGYKLKAFVFFRGRSIVFKDQGEILLLRLAQELEACGKVEQMPKLEGKRMTMILIPKKK